MVLPSRTIILFFFLFVLSQTAAFFNCSRPKPTRSYLRKLLDQADFVATATVLDIYFDADKLSIDRLKILIRRPYKRRELLESHLEIDVYGIVEVEPCAHRLFTSDTKIFSLRMSGGKFYLEAPPINLNLAVLDNLHALSTGRAQRKRRKIDATHCESSLCPLGSKCVRSTGECVCKKTCRTKGPPVCGSDGVSYASFCHLAVRYCALRHSGEGPRLRFRGRGLCEKRNPCDDVHCAPGEQCVVTQSSSVLTAKCICPEECPNYGDSVESSAVCSTHGVDYPSLCHLRHHACESKSNITLKFHGRCDPCNGHKCPSGLSCHVGVDRRPECRCNEQCPLDLKPVCATDGHTYTNECVMRTAACKEERGIDVWKEGKCEEQKSPCQNISCSIWANCRIRNATHAECECNEKCSQVMKPVCGTDRVTYDNECELKRTSCREKLTVRVKHAGTCGTGVCSTFNGCKAPRVCVVVNGKPKCACPKCSDQLMEVCGSDGRTYPNECKLRRAACLSSRKVFVKYNHICEGCANKKCEFYSSCVANGEGPPECKCPEHCPKISEVAQLDGPHKGEVCGTDGVTYSSECHLRRSSCQQKKFIVVAFEGKCDACLHVQCRYGEECRGGVCACTYSCPRDPHPSAQICGENGVMYPSECHMQLAACKKGTLIAEMPLAHCHASTATFPDECQCNKIGSYGNSCDDSGQCKCRPGVGGVKCDHCLPGFWGIHLIAQGAMSCRPCGCSAFGSARSDCEQTTGKCECQNGALGDKCNLCPQDTILTANGCVRSSEYKMPRDCSSQKCHHAAKCVPSPGGLPDCICPNSCSLPHLGIAGNMSVCGSDGNTYESSCQLRDFACKHQIDLVPVALGICEDDTFEVLDRLQREKTGDAGEKKLGSSCSTHEDCAHINAVCVTRPGRRSRCECGDGSRSQGGVCFVSNSGNGSLNLQIGDTCFFLLNPEVTTKSSFSVSIEQLEPGTIMQMETAKMADSIVLEATPKKTLLLRLGSAAALESRSVFKDSAVVEVQWEKDDVVVRFGDESKRKHMRKFEATDVQKIYLGSDASCSKSLSGIISTLRLNEDEVHRNEVRSKKKVPLFLRAVEFRGEASLQFEKLGFDLRDQFQLEIRLKTNATCGLLFFLTSTTAGSDYAMLSLVDSHPVFTFDLGSGPASLKVPKITEDEWTYIKIERQQRNTSVSIDGRPVGAQISSASNVHFDVADPILYLGHVPDETVLPEEQRLNNKPFTGFLRYFSVNEFPLDMHHPTRREGDVRLAEEIKCGEDCQSGTCVEKNQQKLCRADRTYKSMHVDEDSDFGYLNRGFSSGQQSNKSDFSFEVRTLSRAGIIWYEGSWKEKRDGDFLAVFLVEGVLHLAINLGNDGQLKAVSTNRTISDDRWHSVQLTRKERRVEVTVDGKRVITVVTSPGSTFLDTNGLVYLGGRNAAKVRQLARLGLTQKFVGCIRNIEIHSKRINPFTDTISDKTPQNCIH